MAANCCQPTAGNLKDIKLTKAQSITIGVLLLSMWVTWAGLSDGES